MFEFRLINSFFLSIPESPVPEDITAQGFISARNLLAWDINWIIIYLNPKRYNRYGIGWPRKLRFPQDSRDLGYYDSREGTQAINRPTHTILTNLSPDFLKTQIPPRSARLKLKT